MTKGNMTQEEKVIYMTTQPAKRLVCEMAVPTIISMLVTSFYNMADTFFVGKINTQSTAAVGVVFSVMALIQSLGFFFGHGFGNYISRALGAREYEKANVMTANGFFCAFIGGLVVENLLAGNAYIDVYLLTDRFYLYYNNIFKYRLVYKV